MFHRKDAVFMAVAGLLASCGFAMAETTEVKTPSLSLEPTVATAQDAGAPSAPLMMGLDKIGAAKPLQDWGINIYGWVEAGYTYNHRHAGSSRPIAPGPFNHEVGNHFMLNQVDLRFERLVDSKKFDVGGLVELLYGSDAARIHSTGLGYNGTDATDDGRPADEARTFANYHPILQFDIPQAYVDVNIPVGNGLKVRAGKFVTLLGYETIDPRGNPFYSHSYLFSAIPFTQTGIMTFYSFNEQWSMALGVTRGWDIATEDTNGCAIDVLGQVAYVPNKQMSFYLNFVSGPETAGDTSHYRTAINPIFVWQVTDKAKVGVEGLYVYDGSFQSFDNPITGMRVSHAYGDVWGAALYGQYVINDYVTANVRLEKAHTFLTPSSTNFYEVTLGVTVKPLPKDPIGQNLSFRPEIRYDYCEDHVFNNGSNDGRGFKDQLTFGCDVIFTF